MDLNMKNKTKKSVNDYVLEYGEKYRHLFTDALNWLNETEPKWKLKIPIDRDSFIEELTRRSTFDEYSKK